jgi:hypothetical protein
MARKPPARVRAELHRRRTVPRGPDIPGLSPAGKKVVAQLELTRFWPGAVAEALDSWARFVRDPVHRFWITSISCGVPECCEDPDELYRVLHAAASALPAADARMVRLRIADIDDL